MSQSSQAHQPGSSTGPSTSDVRLTIPSLASFLPGQPNANIATQEVKTKLEEEYPGVFDTRPLEPPTLYVCKGQRSLSLSPDHLHTRMITPTTTSTTSDTSQNQSEVLDVGSKGKSTGVTDTFMARVIPKIYVQDDASLSTQGSESDYIQHLSSNVFGSKMTQYYKEHIESEFAKEALETYNKVNEAWRQRMEDSQVTMRERGMVSGNSNDTGTVNILAKRKGGTGTAVTQSFAEARTKHLESLATMLSVLADMLQQNNQPYFTFWDVLETVVRDVKENSEV